MTAAFAPDLFQPRLRGPADEDRLAAALVATLVGRATGVSPGEIGASGRASAAAARARQMAMYLAHICYEWPLQRVGAAFGRDRSTASHACHLIEDLRDDRGFDEALNAIEACLRAAPTPGSIA